MRPFPAAVILPVLFYVYCRRRQEGVPQPELSDRDKKIEAIAKHILEGVGQEPVIDSDEYSILSKLAQQSVAGKKALLTDEAVQLRFKRVNDLRIAYLAGKQLK